MLCANSVWYVEKRKLCTCTYLKPNMSKTLENSKVLCWLLIFPDLLKLHRNQENAVSGYCGLICQLVSSSKGLLTSEIVSFVPKLVRTLGCKKRFSGLLVLRSILNSRFVCQIQVGLAIMYLPQV